MQKSAENSQGLRKAAFLSSLGAGLEYYDFIIYGMMATYLSSLFFPGDVVLLALIKTYAIFSVGYLMRPVGGILFGMIGDTFGRKSSFTTVMFLMAFATLGIGLLPNYAQIGVAAPCLLLSLRLLQGLSFGAELPGAITVICEYAEQKKQGAYSGFLISSVTLGSILASFVLFLLAQSLDQVQILSWGWRLPFLFGGLLAIINCFIRRNLKETPIFSDMQASRNAVSIKEPFLKLVRNHRVEVALGIGVTCFAASLVIFSLYMPTYLNEYMQYPPGEVYKAITWGLVWCAILLPISGRIADHFGKVRTLIVSCLVFIVGAFALFSILNVERPFSLILFMVIYQTVLSFVTVGYLPILAALFPTDVRYTGIAACYNITYSVMSCIPIALTALISVTGSPASAIWFLMASAALSGVCGLVFAIRQELINTFYRNANTITTDP